MAILLAETLITLGAAAQRWCQCQEAWMPLTDAIAFQPAVVPVVGIGDIKSFLTPAALGLAFHQQTADELRCHYLGGAAEEELGEVLGGAE